MRATLRHTEIYFDIAGMQLAPVGDRFIERPVLFLLHGGPGGDHLGFKRHSLALQDVAQLVFIDHRGCGRSKKTKQSDYSLENNIEDIEALRKHLGLKKICILGGSYGGIVAQGYAIRYSKHIEKLILSATLPSYRGAAEAKAYLNEHGTPQQIAIAQHIWNGSFKNHQHVLRYFTLMEPLYSRTARKKRASLFNKSQTVWSHEALNEGFGGFLQHFDFIPKLKKIKCPTLVLAGQEDWICRPSQSKIIATHIPHAQLKIFRDCGHMIAVDAQQRYIKAVKGFLKK
ncbi:MAG: alpha/beta hydrolase [Gammaproteobacteria bacterium]|jgi:proline iminopeptidase|nr:alpha/beta hydrolase [Gammaproteobacteria bacterium]